MNFLNPGITVETVDALYASYKALDIPGYYKAGETNPYAGLTARISRKQRFYAMVPEGDEARLTAARHILKPLARRGQKVVEMLCEKHEINYSQFAPAGRIVLLVV